MSSPASTPPAYPYIPGITVGRSADLLADLQVGRSHRIDLYPNVQSAFQATQPLGNWSFTRSGRMKHRGYYMGPYHAADEMGYRYLALFLPRYKATAEAMLGRFPWAFEVRDFGNEHPNFLKTGVNFANENAGRGSWEVHVKESELGCGAQELLDMLLAWEYLML
ncbi:hypothetical protein LTR22_006491 [Elasticomyces elasticus]|nr:hypothetical protein LTR22_006491 [Elasticomyces elasticus]KAK4926575.1 hypothetical protein LTR49_006509 [Elasticomyces elasticus]KAK5760668.1 hypothetical protein LTS12_009205 [Elasticomyces elasticus]